MKVSLQKGWWIALRKAVGLTGPDHLVMCVSAEGIGRIEYRRVGWIVSSSSPLFSIGVPVVVCRGPHTGGHPFDKSSLARSMVTHRCACLWVKQLWKTGA